MKRGTKTDTLGRFSMPAMLILGSLAAEPKHGYRIMGEVEKVAGVKMGAGTLYGAIARLEDERYITSIAEDDRRRIYRITAEGRRALECQLQEVRAFGNAVRRLAGP